MGHSQRFHALHALSCDFEFGLVVLGGNFAPPQRDGGLIVVLGGLIQSPHTLVSDGDLVAELRGVGMGVGVVLGVILGVVLGVDLGVDLGAGVGYHIISPTNKKIAKQRREVISMLCPTRVRGIVLYCIVLYRIVSYRIVSYSPCRERTWSRRRSGRRYAQTSRSGSGSRSR